VDLSIVFCKRLPECIQTIPDFFLRSERQPGDAGLRGTAGYLWVIVSSQKRPQIAEIQWNPITKNHQMFMEAPKEWAANHHH